MKGQKITNMDIVSYSSKWYPVTVFNLGEEFNIEYVDGLGINSNALMFINDGKDSSIIKECCNCVFIIGWNVPLPTDINDNVIIRTSNPKYLMYCIINKFSLPSFFESKVNPHILIGENCDIDDTAIIGGIDFSPVKSFTGDLVQFPQMGGVSIGNSVVIKCYSVIPRGTFGYTIIGDNTMIDYNCQVGHNCKIGKNCIIAAGSIIGGSTIIGDNVVIGMGSMIRNGIKIGNNVSIGMGSIVIHDIPDNVVVVGNPARIINHDPIFDEGGLK